MYQEVSPCLVQSLSMCKKSAFLRFCQLAAMYFNRKITLYALALYQRMQWEEADYCTCIAPIIQTCFVTSLQSTIWLQFVHFLFTAKHSFHFNEKSFTNTPPQSASQIEQCENQREMCFIFCVAQMTLWCRWLLVPFTQVGVMIAYYKKQNHIQNSRFLK